MIAMPLAPPTVATKPVFIDEGLWVALLVLVGDDFVIATPQDCTDPVSTVDEAATVALALSEGVHEEQSDAVVLYGLYLSRKVSVGDLAHYLTSWGDLVSHPAVVGGFYPGTGTLSDCINGAGLRA